MRFAELHLLRYGRFTDHRITLPETESDLCILFGPNEAGKSTTLTAIEDLLFGIPERSRLDFLHHYKSLRIGAVLSHGGEQLSVQRRKGRKDTLLDPAAGQPLPERVLAPFLGGADRGFMQRMFGLDHLRLQEGGQEILQARNEVGQILFAAGAGLAHLAESLESLEKEAARLWAPRRSRDRRYYQANEAFNTARQALKEGTVPVKEVQALHRHRDEAVAAHEAHSRKLEDINTRKAALDRMRRVRPTLDERRRCLDRIRKAGAGLNHRLITAEDPKPAGETASLEPVEPVEPIEPAEPSGLGAPPAAIPDFPDDARETVAAVQETLARTEERLRGLALDREHKTAALKALKIDNALLRAADGIEALYKRSSAIESEAADLPKRRAEAEQFRRTLARQAAELEWPERNPDAIEARLPSHSRVKEIRTLVEQHGRLEVTRNKASEALEQAQRVLGEHRKAVATQGTAADPIGLDLALGQARQALQQDSERKRLAREIADLDQQQSRALAALRPTVRDMADLEALSVPESDTIKRFQGELNRLDGEIRASLREQADLDAKAKGLEIRRTDLINHEEAVDLDLLHRTREKRQAVWSRLRHRLDASSTPPPSGPSASGPSPSGSATGADADADADASLCGDARDEDCFERLSAEADILADRCHAHAGATEALKTVKADLREVAGRLAQSRLTVAAGQAQRQAVLDDWQSRWTNGDGTGLVPDSPDHMLDWLNRRDRILSDQKQRLTRIRDLRLLEDGAEEARHAVIAGLAELAAAHGEAEDARLQDFPLSRVTEQADAAMKRLSLQAETRRALAGQIDKESRIVQDRERELEQAGAALTEWGRRWEAATQALGLDPDRAPDVVGGLLDGVEALRRTLAELTTLQENRIDKIEHDIALFEQDVRTSAVRLAPDLAADNEPAAAAATAAATVAAVKRRLDDSRKARQQQEQLEAELTRLAEEKAMAERSQEEARIRLAPLLEQAGVDTLPTLMTVIEQARELADHRRRLAELDQTLSKQGDGRSLETLEAECAGEDPDRIAARATALEREQAAAQETLEELARARWEAEQACAALTPKEDAAVAAADRQAALAAMEQAASDHLRYAVAARLLRWGLERYRQRHQAPLLARAGALFRILTVDRYHGLKAEFGIDDQPQLVGLRGTADDGDADAVAVDGMSDGTRDQLYLALRIAAVEAYLADSGHALPFIADDLFVNFDDDRAAAGFRVLNDLARHTQVLYFTHHRHLLEVAAGALGRMPFSATLT